MIAEWKPRIVQYEICLNQHRDPWMIYNSVYLVWRQFSLPVEMILQFSYRFDVQTGEFINYWFLQEQQLELLSLLQHIEAINQKVIQRFLKVIFSSTIIAKSGGVSLARDLAHTRPHKDANKIPNSAFIEFGKRLERNLAECIQGEFRGLLIDSQTAYSSEQPAFHIRATGANKTGLSSESVDLIVTSPPYANNAIDYMRAHKFSLVWLRSHQLGGNSST